MKKYLFMIVTISFILPVFAQQEKSHEVNSEVKELMEFHDVIYQIWHTGWPQKDIKLLISLTPDIEKGFDKIRNTELPGILRDKKSKWDDGLKKFKIIVEMYKAAAAKKDSVLILNTAEKIHSQFEALVRMVRPVLKEVDAFHQELYVLYHYNMPKYDYMKVQKSAVALKEKMKDLMKAQLSERMKAKKDAFEKCKTELNTTVDKLNEVAAKSDDKSAINTAVDAVHSKYQELEKIFD
jgi:hypothetical protein